MSRPPTATERRGAAPATAGCCRPGAGAAAVLAPIGPLLIVLVYSFLTPGQYGNVVWEFSLGRLGRHPVQRDIFDGTLTAGRRASDDLLAVGEAVAADHAITFAWAFRPPGSSPRGPRAQRAMWLFLITIPFWTNLLIRTFAINEVIRNEGLMNTS
jgi:spermidine/putrescine transport system permease protein